MFVVLGVEVSMPAALEVHRRGSALVGRADVRSMLLSDWAMVVAGGWRVAVLSGEAGIGKTRLAAELAEDARREGATVLFGACAAEAIVPYQPIVEALRPAIDADRALAGPELAPLLPGLFDAPGVSTPPDASADRFRLFQAIGATLRSIARRRPTVLVLDDLQWADSDTVALIGQLLRTTQDLSLLTIATVRDTDLDPRGSLLDLLADLRTDERVRRLQVDGLSAEEVAQLGATLAGHSIEPDDPAVKTVHDRSRGNAFFARELWGHVLEGRADLPTGVRAAVFDRVSRLDDDDVDILTMAATIGTTFPFDVLVSATGRTDLEIESVLDRAIAKGLVADHEGSEIAYRFQHDLVRETLGGAGLGARRQRRHAKVAAAIVAVRGDTDPADVTHHLVLAGQFAVPEELVRHAAAAARRAETVLAWSDAALHWRTAADAAERANLAASERAELRLGEGISWGRANDVDAAVVAYTEAARLAREADAPAIDARIVMWRATHTLYQSAADAPAALEALDAVRARASFLDAATAAQLFSHLAVASWTSGHLDAAVEFAQQAITLGRSVGDSAACSRAESSLGLVAWLGLELDSAATWLTTAVADGKASDDPWLASATQARLALTLLWLGRVTEARDNADAALASAIHDGNASAQGIALGALAGVALVDGRFAAVEGLAVDADVALAVSGYQWFGPIVASSAAAANFAVGAWAEGDRWLEHTGADEFDAFGSTDVARWLLTLSGRALRGDQEIVRTEAARHPTRIDGRIMPMVGTTQLLAALADLADLAGVVVPADRLVRRLDRVAAKGLVLVEGSGALVDRVRAQVARLAGDEQRAEELVVTAQRTAEQLGALPELARCTLEAGRLALSSDRVRAAELFDEASERFSALGMTPWHQRAEALAGWTARRN